MCNPVIFGVVSAVASAASFVGQREQAKAQQAALDQSPPTEADFQSFVDAVAALIRENMNRDNAVAALHELGELVGKVAWLKGWRITLDTSTI